MSIPTPDTTALLQSLRARVEARREDRDQAGLVAALNSFLLADPASANGWLQLGWAEADTRALRRSLALDPTRPAVYRLLAACGEIFGKRGVLLAPDLPEMWVNAAFGSPEERRWYLERYLRLDPVNAAIHEILAILEQHAHPQIGATHAHRAQLLDPSQAVGAIVLAGRGVEALDQRFARWSERALVLAPDSRLILAQRLFQLDFDPKATIAEQQRVRRMWASLLPDWPIGPHGNEPDPERRIRIGYVSADFKMHSVINSFGGVIGNHDRSQFEVWCYDNCNRTDDPIHQQLRPAVDHWIDTRELSDEELGARIRDDGIDILIDLSGHSLGGRVEMLARKPAPVQLSGWGYPFGTGLSQVDGLLLDPYVVEPADRHLFVERIIELPCMLGFHPVENRGPVAPPPILTKGYPTFGTLNRMTRIGPLVLDLWARVLHAVPNSRLLIKNRELSFPRQRQRVIDMLGEKGIAADRLDLRGASTSYDHARTCDHIDVGLDCFPSTGGITTLEMLWMGVPVVTLLGHTPAGRVSGSILTALGLPELIVPDADAYVALASQLAGDRDRLTALRGTTRGLIEASPIGDVIAYTRAVEREYRLAWRRWCADIAKAS